MKHTLLCLALVLTLGASAFGGGKSLIVSVRNPSSFVRKSETIAVPLKRIQSLLHVKEGTSFAVSKKGETSPLLSQQSEGELLFQADLQPHKTQSFTISVGAPDVNPAVMLVDGRFVPPREDYAWENDHIAFRMYGPALAAESNNGIDVWTKRVRTLIVAKWYKEAEGAPAGKDPYHHDRGEGADFFTVGRSLGAGGSGLWIDGKVLQPGVFATYRTIANGPLRVAFELTYRWKVGKDSLIERKKISLDAGQNLNRVEVTFEGKTTQKSLTIPCGLVKRADTRITKDEQGHWMGLWGVTNAEAENGSLGTGVVLEGKEAGKFTEDNDQYIMLKSSEVGHPFVYYAGAGWTRSGDFSSEADWNTYLKQAAERINQPVTVSLRRQ